MWSNQNKQSDLIHDKEEKSMSKEPLSPKAFFEKLNKNTMHLVDEFYDTNALFKDPLVELQSRAKIKTYYANLYNNVEMIKWEIPEEIIAGDQCTLVWTMTLQAKGFNGGKPVVVDGISFIKFGGSEGKAVYHRDYFDLGAFVYEWVPVLGGMVRFVKGKMASHHKEK